MVLVAQFSVMDQGVLIERCTNLAILRPMQTDPNAQFSVLLASPLGREVEHSTWL